MATGGRQGCFITFHHAPDHPVTYELFILFSFSWPKKLESL